MAPGAPFDIESLKLAPGLAAKAAARRETSPPKRSHRSEFVMLPVAWMRRLRDAQFPATWPIAVHILFEHWKLSGRRHVRVSNALASAAGVAPRTKRRAVRELERLGLIRVERAPKKSPLVVELGPFEHGPRRP
jgi:hypothetical protein